MGVAVNAQTKSKIQKTTKAKNTVIKPTKASKEKITTTSTPVVKPKVTRRVPAAPVKNNTTIKTQKSKQSANSTQVNTRKIVAPENPGISEQEYTKNRINKRFKIEDKSLIEKRKLAQKEAQLQKKK